MTLSLPTDQLIGFLLALVRAAAWVTVAPPFHTRTVPAPVRVGVAVALALPAAPLMAAHRLEPQLPALLPALLLQVAAGLALGFLAQLLFTAVQAAGDLVDMVSGFTLATVFDLMSNASSALIGRVYYLLALMLLFATNAHLLLARGFLASLEAAPLAGTDALRLFTRSLVETFGVFLLAAVELAAPLLGVLFLTDLALGLVSRAAPQMNLFALGLPVKVLLTLLLVGLALPLLPGAVAALVDRILHTLAALTKATG